RTIKKPPRFGGMKTYNWEGVNPDGYFLDKLEPIPSALPSFQKLFQVSATALSIPDRKSGSAGMPRPISYAVFCLKKKKIISPAENWTGLCSSSHVSCARRILHPP